MSYSLSTTATTKSDLPASIADQIAARPDNGDPDSAPAVDEHLTAIASAVEALAAVVGRPEDPVVVSISGHANPDHGPREGYSNETLTISISASPG